MFNRKVPTSVEENRTFPLEHLQLKLFSIRDLKAGTYGNPFVMHNRGVAMRTFQTWCQNPEAFFSKFPHDFELFEMGAFCTQTGVFSSLPAPDYVCRASDLVQSAT